MKHVCYFRHALALDERRVKFLPEYAYGGKTIPDENTPTDGPSAVKDKLTNNEGPPFNEKDNVRASLPHKNIVDLPKDKKKDSGKHQHTLEVWFAGTHSDM